MSKSKTIIAGLGVVAALGVAALPLGSYAATVSSNVDLYVEVKPAIAMTIAGNNDGTLHNDSADTGKYTKVGEATAVAAHTDHTEQDVTAFDPAAIASSTFDCYSVPAATVTGYSSSFASIFPNSMIDGSTADSTADGYGFKSTITVYTNSETGYTLSVEDGDSDTALRQLVPNSSTVSASIPTGGTIAASTAA